MKSLKFKFLRDKKSQKMNHFDTKRYDAKFSKLYEFAIFVDFHLESILKKKYSVVYRTQGLRPFFQQESVWGVVWLFVVSFFSLF